jgi:hypothetical protein
MARHGRYSIWTVRYRGKRCLVYRTGTVQLTCPDSFEIAYQRLTDLLKARHRMLEEMREHVVRALELTKAGKTREARVLLRKAEALQKKLGLSSPRR